MTDDIVTRLRARHQQKPHRYPPDIVKHEEVIYWRCAECGNLIDDMTSGDCTVDWRSPHLEHEAADEIERWQDIARRLYLFIQDPCTPNHWCDVCSSIDAYEKAVNNG